MQHHCCKYKSMVCDNLSINRIFWSLFKGQKVTYCCFNLEAYAQHTPLSLKPSGRIPAVRQRAVYPSWRYQIWWKDASVHHLMDVKWLDTLWPVMLPNSLILFHRSVLGTWWNIYVRVRAHTQTHTHAPPHENDWTYVAQVQCTCS